MKLKLKTMLVRRKFAWWFIPTDDNYLLRYRFYYSTGSWFFAKNPSFGAKDKFEWLEQSRWVDKQTAEADAARWELIHLNAENSKGQ